MRKIISSILAVAVVLASFSIVAFADPTTNLYFNDGSDTIAATSDTVTLTLYLDKNDEEILTYGYTGLSIKYTISNADVATTALKDSSNFDTSVEVNTTTLLYAGTDFYVPGAAKDAIATYTITRKDDATSSVITISDVLLSDYSTPYTYACTYPETVTINWPSAGPSVTGESAEYKTSTITGTNGKSYKDVPTYGVSATVSGTATTLTFKLNVNYEEDGTAAAAPKVLDGGSVVGYISDGTVTFRAAIVGVPTNVEITGITPVFTAN